MDKKQEVSLLVSASGGAGSLIGKLVTELRKRQFSDEEIYAYYSNSRSAGSIVEVADKIEEDLWDVREDYTFKLVVGKHITTKKALAAGKYSSVDPDVNSRNFPIRPRKEEYRKIVLLRSCYNIHESDEMLASEVMTLGLKRPEYEDAFDFGEQFPLMQKKFWIFFPHEPWRDSDGNLKMISLGSYCYNSWEPMRRRERFLGLDFYPDIQIRHGKCLFAFVK